MLPINFTNAVVPGGPVSSVAGANEIFGGAATIKSADEKSAGARSTIAGARVLAGRFEVARRILQHSVEFVFGFAGLEWNGQPLGFVCALPASAPIVQ